MRDTLHIKDIDGAQPRKHKVKDIATRETMKIDDIEGAHAKIRH